MNFLALCQDLVSELGIEGGSGPSSVTSQTGELANVVRWIRDADLYVSNLHIDWLFLWALHTEAAVVGSDVVPTPTAPIVINKVDKGSFWLDKGTADAKHLTFLEWGKFRRIYENGVVKPTRQPAVFSIKPDRTMVFDSLADDTYSVSYEYWARRQSLEDNTDDPVIPEQFHRIIIVKAKLAYAAREDAPEIQRDAAAEYTDLLEKLESQEWPGNEYATTASASDDGGSGDITVSPE